MMAAAHALLAPGLEQSLFHVATAAALRGIRIAAPAVIAFLAPTVHPGADVPTVRAATDAVVQLFITDAMIECAQNALSESAFLISISAACSLPIPYDVLMYTTWSQ